jgi:hypothetical protein
MSLEGVLIGEIDGVLLVRIFCDVLEVKTEGFAQATELDLALVFEAKLERLLRNLLC